MSNIHLGNVAEYSEQFPTPAHIEDRLALRRTFDSLASTAPFYSTSPGCVVLPRLPEDDRWWQLVSEPMQWNDLEPRHVEVGAGGALSSAVRGDQILVERIGALAANGGQLLCWGESPSFRGLVAEQDPSLAPRSLGPSDMVAVDSKTASRDIFEAARRTCVADITVPLTIECGNAYEFDRALRAVSRDGRRAVVKAPYGVGGYGTAVLDGNWMTTERVRRQALDMLRAGDHHYETWPLIVQEHVHASGHHADLTGDGEVMPDGSVEYRGGAVMLMDGTHYAGAVTGSDASVPDATWQDLHQFTLAVGHELAARGYRGWFDVDFLRTSAGGLVALEANARRTGPMVPLVIAKRRSELLESGGGAVACLDHVLLPRRLSSAEMFEVFASCLEDVERNSIIPTHFLAMSDPQPSVGFAAAGSTAAIAFRLLQSFSANLIARIGN